MMPYKIGTRFYHGDNIFKLIAYCKEPLYFRLGVEKAALMKVTKGPQVGKLHDGVLDGGIYFNEEEEQIPPPLPDETKSSYVYMVEELKTFSVIEVKVKFKLPKHEMVNKQD
jgi:hypothetical protein